MSGVRRQSVDMLFADEAAPPNVAAALAAHRNAMQAWLASPLSERPLHWRAVEAAWRTVKLLGVADEAKRNAANLAIHSGKLRGKSS